MERCPQKPPPSLRVTSQLLRCTGAENPALINNVCAIRHRQRLPHIVVRDQNSDPARPQIRNNLLQIQNGDGVNSRKRLVQKDERRIDTERTGDLNSPPLSPPEGISLFLT